MLKKIIIKYKYLKYLFFILPAFAIWAIFSIFPNLQIYYLTFFDWNGMDENKKFVGLQNFTDLTFNPNLTTVIRNTIIYILVMVLIQTLIALLLALVLKRNSRFNKFYRVFIFSPVVLSTIVVAMIWSYLLDPNLGVFNYLLKFIDKDLTINFLKTATSGVFSVASVNLWHTMGISLVIILGGLKTIPDELYEVSSIDGASKSQQFFHITIPLLAPTLLRLMLLALISASLVFDYIYAMGGSALGAAKIDTLPVFMYRYLYDSSSSNVGLPAAIGSMLSFILIIFFVVQYIVTRKIEERNI